MQLQQCDLQSDLMRCGIHCWSILAFRTHLLCITFGSWHRSSYVTNILTALVIRNQGDQANRARIDVELISDQDRPNTNQELVNQWRAATTLPSEIDNISFGRGNRWGGESGDIVIALTGDNIDTLKSAAMALQVLHVGCCCRHLNRYLHWQHTYTERRQKSCEWDRQNLDSAHC